MKQEGITECYVDRYLDRGQGGETEQLVIFSSVLIE